MSLRILILAALSVVLGASSLVTKRDDVELSEPPQTATIASVSRLWDTEPLAIASTHDWLFGTDIFWHQGQPVLVFGTGDFNHVLSRSEKGEWDPLAGAGRGVVFSMNDRSLASLHRTGEGFQFVQLYDDRSRRVGSNEITIQSVLSNQEMDLVKYKFVEHAEYIDDQLYAFLYLSDGEIHQLLMLSSEDPETTWRMREVTQLSGWIGSNLPVLISDPDQIYLMTSDPDRLLLHVTQDGGENWLQRTVRVQDDQQGVARQPVQVFRREDALGLIYLSYNLSVNSHVRYYYTESTDGGMSWQPSALITEFAPYQDEGVDYTDFTQVGDIMVFAHITHGEDGEEGRVLLSSDGLKWVQVDVGKRFERAPDWISVSANKAGNRLIAATVLSKLDWEDDQLFIQELDLR